MKNFHLNINFVLLTIAALTLVCASESQLPTPEIEQQLAKQTEETVATHQQQLDKVNPFIISEQKRTQKLITDVKNKIFSSQALTNEIKEKYSNCHEISCLKQLEAQLEAQRDELASKFNALYEEYKDLVNTNNALATKIKETWEKITQKSNEIKTK